MTRVNAVWYPRVHNGGNQAQSNFSLQCLGSGSVFALDADTTYTDTDAWPRSLGAPVTTDGSPRVYGDRMLWGSFCPVSNPDAPYFTSPFQDLRINTAVYAYDREDLREVRFVRYEVTNTGTEPITGLRVGYWSDTDSPTGAVENVGFDAGTGLSYTYNLNRREGGSYAGTASSGFAFLETPNAAPLLAHRIMRKNFDPLYWENVERVNQVLFALDGLDNEGNPMIDPITNQPSRFAFTGDPFAGDGTPGSGTGWLDCYEYERDGETHRSCNGVDIRHMSSAGPITLAPGETVVTTLFVHTAIESTPQDSYESLRQTLNAVRSERSLWQFDPQS